MEIRSFLTNDRTNRMVYFTVMGVTPTIPPQPVPPEQMVGDLIQPGHPLFGLVWVNPDRLSGEPCLSATRVPVRNLFDTLAAGQSMAEFLDDFEGVTAEQASEVLNLAKLGLLQPFATT